jgi:hypothetical protein
LEWQAQSVACAPQVIPDNHTLTKLYKPALAGSRISEWKALREDAEEEKR